MELKEIYKNEKHTASVRGRRVVIENDKSKFPLYKKLGLDVFKDKKNDTTDKGGNK